MCDLRAVGRWLVELDLLTSVIVHGSRRQRRKARFVNDCYHCAWLDVLS